MEQHIVKIIDIQDVTHDVKRFIVERPSGYSFNPGQATEVSINLPGYTDEKRPFTFTGLNSWDHLEFTIKIYNDHNGVTKKLGALEPGSELIIHDVWGTINYKGPGLFIAGGAGVTPFIAIFRYLQSKNKIGSNSLMFANKTASDIILKEEFKILLGNNFINILSDETSNGFAHGFITEEFLKQNIKDHKLFYLCGPPAMMDIIEKHLSHLNADPASIIKEAF